MGDAVNHPFPLNERSTLQDVIRYLAGFSSAVQSASGRNLIQDVKPSGAALSTLNNAVANQYPLFTGPTSVALGTLTPAAIAFLAQSSAVFTAAGVGHSSGLVPDPGNTSHSPPWYLGDDAAFHALPASPGVFGAAGVSHSTGLVPDPGVTAHTPPWYLGDDAAFHQVFPSPTRAGDLIYWNGTTWVALAGNNSGTSFLQEDPSGNPSWGGIFTGVAPGLVPASGGGTANFLRADGTFAAVSNGRVLLNTLTGSAVTSLQDTTSFTGTYNDYEIVIDNVVAGTVAAFLQMQVQSGGTFQATGYSQLVWANRGSTTTNFTSGLTSTTSILLLPSTVGQPTTGAGLCMECRIYGVNQTTTPKPVRFTGVLDDTAYTVILGGGAWRGGNGAVTGVKFFMSSGPFTGTIKIYGLP